MLHFLYKIGIRFYGLGLGIAALFSPKARLWVHGRKSWAIKLQEASADFDSWIWFHCASLGEFEQARNLIEYLKTQHPHKGILLSFFSPSGYEIRKNYSYADYVCYLPLDTPQNARKFLSLLQPQLIFFVKYEIWINFIREIERKELPLVLLSARVRESSNFFKSPLAPLYKKAFASFEYIFAQDQISLNLLQSFSGNPQIKVSSDTRYDRVLSNKAAFREIASIQSFKKNRLCIICGSTWPKAEKMLLEAFSKLSASYDLCILLAPHEIRKSRIDSWMAAYPNISLPFSQIEELQEQHRILWIDNIGMLSRLYHYGDIAYVGGGWGTGLHNILEAATFGCPVLIGPIHDKFPEAAEMIEAGGCFEIKDQASLEKKLESLIKDQELRISIQRINTNFIEERSGASEKVISWMKEKGYIDS